MSSEADCFVLRVAYHKDFAPTGECRREWLHLLSTCKSPSLRQFHEEAPFSHYSAIKNMHIDISCKRLAVRPFHNVKLHFLVEKVSTLQCLQQHASHAGYGPQGASLN